MSGDKNKKQIQKCSSQDCLPGGWALKGRRHPSQPPGGKQRPCRWCSQGQTPPLPTPQSGHRASLPSSECLQHGCVTSSFWREAGLGDTWKIPCARMGTSVSRCKKLKISILNSEF